MPAWMLTAASLERRRHLLSVCIPLLELCPAESAVHPGAADLLSARRGGPAGRSRGDGRGARAASARAAGKKSPG